MRNIIVTAIRCEVCGFKPTEKDALYIAMANDWDPGYINDEGWSLPIERKSGNFKLVACSRCFREITNFKGYRDANN